MLILLVCNSQGTLSVWMASLLVMVNIFARSGQHVDDFCVYKRQGCDWTPEHAGILEKGEVDGLCLLVKDELGKVRVFSLILMKPLINLISSSCLFASNKVIIGLPFEFVY